MTQSSVPAAVDAAEGRDEGNTSPADGASAAAGFFAPIPSDRRRAVLYEVAQMISNVRYLCRREFLKLTPADFVGALSLAERLEGHVEQVVEDLLRDEYRTGEKPVCAGRRDYGRWGVYAADEAGNASFPVLAPLQFGTQEDAEHAARQHGFVVFGDPRVVRLGFAARAKIAAENRGTAWGHLDRLAEVVAPEATTSKEIVDAAIAALELLELPRCTSCRRFLVDGGVKDGDELLCLKCGGEQ